MKLPVDPGLRRKAQAWIADDPDEGDRRFLKDLLAAASAGGPAGDDAAADLAARFAGGLHFGTAGLRAPVGAGPARLNRAVVRATTAGVAAWLRAETPDAATRGVVVGCDARHRSRELWEETAAVLAGAGIPALVLAPAQPTPLLAFATRHLGAAAGIMITASHNPAADNGYKLYVGDGAQILPSPADAVEAAIAAVGPLAGVPVAPAGDPRIVTVPRSVTDAYLDSVAAMAPAPDGAGLLRVVHTAMHGVSTGLFDAAVARAGHPPVHHVAAQAAPDPDFPTVAFPNPEEPGAMDLALADARLLGADLVLANDPDGDRLAVAVAEPAAQGGWRVMTGDQLGALLGAAVLAGEVGPGLAGGAAEQRVVASSLVSSTMLAAIAADAGATWVETLTGFKWIARGAAGVAGGRLVFGYEEALGYLVGDAVADKDGIGAALAVLALAAADRARGRTLLHRVDDIERRYGVHATRQVSRRLPSAPAAETVAAKLRSAPPADIGGVKVLSVEDLSRGGRLPPTDAIVFQLEGCRVVVRPSGTEPKIKAYLEARQPPTPDLAAARAGADAVLDRVAAGVAGLLDG
ncbi:phospho-sugar mutase [Acidiferrimicrobium sp. IK]|uniref:phospho-sugar mutase n=1 Tax=Acidiferrimicrobium sp. IK TaxID=2871700 RepID=UPI0021CB9884|nr:phospho-sugar mutase [Acidiferrimicrobium sp. IK]MCU4185830.1 phospho-sugar mutase [Acidiferrimicrobium sp. IK]